MEKDVTCHMTISGSGKDHEELFAAYVERLLDAAEEVVFAWANGAPLDKRLDDLAKVVAEARRGDNDADA